MAKERVLKKENQGTIFSDASLKRRYFASFRFFNNFRSWICSFFLKVQLMPTQYHYDNTYSVICRGAGETVPHT